LPSASSALPRFLKVKAEAYPAGAAASGNGSVRAAAELPNSFFFSDVNTCTVPRFASR
jgi:hypothetical protein